MLRRKIVFGAPKLWILVGVAFMLGACAVTQSYSVRQVRDQRFICESELGSYALPRSVLQFTVTQVEENFVLQKVDVRRFADNAHIYCLDHLRSAFADDTIRVHKEKVVVRNPAEQKAHKEQLDAEDADTVARRMTSPFLQLIGSKAIDHTAGIIRNAIRAAFILISNNPGFTPAREGVALRREGASAVVANLEADPFDFEQMADLNRGLRRFGFCVALDNYTFNRNRAAVSHYCDAPVQVSGAARPVAADAIQNMQFHVPEPASGIFYRPRAPYNLYVYTKHYPDDPGEWTLALTKVVELENIMPVVSVGVDRAIFAERRTGLVFDDGMLINVCIMKGSEVEAFIDIPLDIVYGIISLPTETLRAAFQDRKTRTQLIQTEQRLIKAQNDYIAFLERGDNVVIENDSADGARRPSTLTLSDAIQPGTVEGGADTALPNPPGQAAASDAAIFENSESVLNDICKNLTAAG